MGDNKPRVLCFGAERAMVEQIKLALSHSFEVTGVAGVADLDEALNVIRQIGPEYVLVDLRLSGLDHQQLYLQLKADKALEEIQILAISDGEFEL
jgi:DNA-binding response OmpR family regulator